MDNDPEPEFDNEEPEEEPAIDPAVGGDSEE